jgi:hypothetical protein
MIVVRSQRLCLNVILIINRDVIWYCCTESAFIHKINKYRGKLLIWSGHCDLISRLIMQKWEPLETVKYVVALASLSSKVHANILALSGSGHWIKFYFHDIKSWILVTLGNCFKIQHSTAQRDIVMLTATVCMPILLVYQMDSIFFWGFGHKWRQIGRELIELQVPSEICWV